MFFCFALGESGERQAANIVNQTARALHYAHKRGIAHRVPEWHQICINLLQLSLQTADPHALSKDPRRIWMGT